MLRTQLRVRAPWLAGWLMEGMGSTSSTPWEPSNALAAVEFWHVGAVLRGRAFKL